jgi:hypothetical protein
LLRLPGEILNTIYHYVYANLLLVVETWDDLNEDGRSIKTMTCLYVHQSGPCSGFWPNSDSLGQPIVPGSKLRSLMFACRKTYAETRLMPFQKSIFFADYYSFALDLLQTQLGYEHFDAITTVLVGNWIRPGELGWRRRRWTVEPDSLVNFKGLKRVIVGGYRTDEKEAVVNHLRQGLQLPELEVV